MQTRRGNLQDAGLDDALSFSKGCYTGQEPIARLHYRGQPARALMGLVLPDGAELPGPDTSLLVEDRITPILLGWYRGNPGAGATIDPIPFLLSTANDSDRAKMRVTALVDGNQESPQSITLEYALLP